jgi:hypothetical protein
MPYVRPEDVRAPRESWRLSEVLIDRGKNSNRYSSEAWSLVCGRWCGVPCLGIRLNGSDASPEGYPIGFGEPVWFILPTEFNRLALPLLLADKRATAEHFLPSGANTVSWPPAGNNNAATWRPPEEVHSPRERWRLESVLMNQGESPLDGKPAKFSLAIGWWENLRCIAVRWNGNAAHPNGNPVAGGRATWFPLPMQLIQLPQ